MKLKTSRQLYVTTENVKLPAQGIVMSIYIRNFVFSLPSEVFSSFSKINVIHYWILCGWLHLLTQTHLTLLNPLFTKTTTICETIQAIH